MYNYKNYILFFFILISATFAFNAYPAIERTLYNGIRPLGMGDAYTSISDDFNAVFYNPAGLVNIENELTDFYNPFFETSLTDSPGFFSNVHFPINSLLLPSNLSDSLSAASNGENLFARLSFFPHFIKPNLLLGIIFNATYNGSYDPTTNNSLTDVNKYVTIKENTDFGISFGFSKTFIQSNPIKIGFSINPIYRISINGNYKLKNIIQDQGLSLDRYAEEAILIDSIQSFLF